MAGAQICDLLDGGNSMYLKKNAYALLMLSSICYATEQPQPATVTALPSNTIGIAYDSFRGIADGSWPSNVGAVAKYALAWPAHVTEQDVYGLQLSASVGVYNWSGQLRPLDSGSNRPMYQAFVSAGAFKSSAADLCAELGAVYDAMLTHNYGLFGLSPKLGQLRLQLSGNLLHGHALGMWGTHAIGSASDCMRGQQIQFRAINQLNALYRYRWNECSSLTIWAGAPYGKGLWCCRGRPGKYIFGFKLAAALTDSLILEGYGSYMGPPSSSCQEKNLSCQANVCIGLRYYFGGCPDRVQPYLDMANNSNFLIDTSTTM